MSTTQHSSLWRMKSSLLVLLVTITLAFMLSLMPTCITLPLTTSSLRLLLSALLTLATSHRKEQWTTILQSTTTATARHGHGVLLTALTTHTTQHLLPTITSSCLSNWRQARTTTLRLPLLQQTTITKRSSR